MSEQPQPPLKPDPEHLRQVGLQIWLPLGIALAVILGLTTLAIVMAATDNGAWQQWRDFSVIWLILPLCLGNLILIAILGGLVYVTAKAHKGMLTGLRKVQGKVETISQVTRNAAEKAAQPMIKAGGWGAGIEALTRQVKKLFGRE